MADYVNLGKQGRGYPVNAKWQLRVIGAIKRMGISEVAFAKLVRMAPSTLHKLLHSPLARYSSRVPDIHKALHWPPPPESDSVIDEDEADELVDMFRALPEDIRKIKEIEIRALAAIYAAQKIRQK